MRRPLSLEEYLAKANTYAQQGYILGMMNALDTAHPYGLNIYNKTSQPIAQK